MIALFNILLFAMDYVIYLEQYNIASVCHWPYAMEADCSSQIVYRLSYNTRWYCIRNLLARYHVISGTGVC
jgi:hypothetical protein